jgi:hypothetical protein
VKKKTKQKKVKRDTKNFMISVESGFEDSMCPHCKKVIHIAMKPVVSKKLKVTEWKWDKSA